MKSITEDDLERLATLAALKIPKDRLASLCRDMNQMNSFVAAIKKVDVSKVVGPISAANVETNLRTRPDEEREDDGEREKINHGAVGAQTILQNAALKRGSFFAVPNAKA